MLQNVRSINHFIEYYIRSLAKQQQDSQDDVGGAVPARADEVLTGLPHGARRELRKSAATLFCAVARARELEPDLFERMHYSLDSSKGHHESLLRPHMRPITYNDAENEKSTNLAYDLNQACSEDESAMEATIAADKSKS
ncbi:hypothetical protein KIN20_008431 [Parelaphostrongylus tenuis]|uniref:Uncharacterized protein n=1 Tax=Parelaphostrongylus tenuis TaxID=148309 RepID=A0AAD5M808_PARTN|nr:hypothetical protein KIN20_008431 [Parelaphostrongylus tenuis]